MTLHLTLKIVCCNHQTVSKICSEAIVPVGKIYSFNEYHKIKNYMDSSQVMYANKGANFQSICHRWQSILHSIFLVCQMTEASLLLWLLLMNVLDDLFFVLVLVLFLLLFSFLFSFLFLLLLMFWVRFLWLLLALLFGSSLS